MNFFHTHPIAAPVARPSALRLAAMLCPLLLATALAPAHAQPEPGPELAGANGLQSVEVRRADIPTLKAAYLECDRNASQRMLAHGEAMMCSEGAEAVLMRAFSGDFGRLLAWWNAEKALRLAAQAAPGNTSAARP